jgi:hypothetical protein
LWVSSLWTYLMKPAREKSMVSQDTRTGAFQGRI